MTVAQPEENSQRTLVEIPERRRRRPVHVPYKAKFPVSCLIDSTETYNEWALQVRSKYFTTYDKALWDRYCVNSEPDEPGSVAEELAALRALVGELAELGAPLCTYRRQLAEWDPGINPRDWDQDFDPADQESQRRLFRRLMPELLISQPIQLRELLDRLVPQWFGKQEDTVFCGGGHAFGDTWDPDDDEPYLTGPWPLVRLERVRTSYDSWADGAVLVGPREAFTDATLKEGIAAKKWPVPMVSALLASLRTDAESQGTDPGPRVLIKPEERFLIDKMSGLEAAGWAGSKAGLARELGWNGTVMGLNSLVSRLESKMAAENLYLIPTGRQIGSSRLVEWTFRRENKALSPSRPSIDS